MSEQIQEQVEEIRSLGRSAFQIVCLCFMLMTLGSIVRATDSGLSCPDWPMCFGRLIPQMDIQIFLEWFHRLIALLMGILLASLGWRVLRSSFLRSTFSKEILLAAALFLGQCVLGGLTVLKLLKPSIVSSHLLTALLFFALLIWIWRRASSLTSNTKARVSAPVERRGLILATCLTYLQLGLGGMVSSNNAGLICPDFPKCHGMWLPMNTFLTWIQMGHRYLAFVLFFFALGLFWKARAGIIQGPARLAIQLFPVLLALQIFLGVLNIFYAMPLSVRAAHHANAIFMFALLFVGAADLYLVSVRQSARSKLPTLAREFSS